MWLSKHPVSEFAFWGKQSSGKHLDERLRKNKRPWRPGCWQSYLKLLLVGHRGRRVHARTKERGGGGRSLQLFLVVPRLLCEVCSASACPADSGFQGVSSEMQCSVETTLTWPGPGVKRPQNRISPKCHQGLWVPEAVELGGMLSPFFYILKDSECPANIWVTSRLYWHHLVKRILTPL